MKHEERHGQCEYHYGEEISGLRLVTLTHNPEVSQAPMWICPKCREQLRGHFEYAEEGVPK